MSLMSSVSQEVVSGSNNMLSLLDARRSAPAHGLVAPGPSDAELKRLLASALRVPDHGKLTPWRLIVLQGDLKDELADRLDRVADTREDAMKARAGVKKLRTPPLALAVVSTAAEGRIPEWEQVLSAGALSMNILIAAQAMGFGANWVTGWYAYDETARKLLDLQPHEKVAAIILIGTVAEGAPERPRPDVEAVTSWPTALAG